MAEKGAVDLVVDLVWNMRAIINSVKPFQTLSKRGQIARLAKLAEQALLDFDVESLSLVPLEHMANTTFRVEAANGDRYVLRIQNPSASAVAPERSDAEVRSEMEWLTALHHDTDLIIPVPLRTHNNDLLTRVEVEGVPEARTCVLFRWVDGRFINKGLTPRHLERVGVFMAALHEHVTRQFVPSAEFTRRAPDGLPPDVVDSILNTVAAVRPPQDVRLVEAIIDRVQRVFDALGTGPDVFGLIHADLHQSNYLFHAGQVRAIDFDDCGYAHFLYDFAVTLNEVMHKPHYLQLRSSLLHGYRSGRPLPEEHERYLDIIVALRDLQLITWFIEQRNHPAFTRLWEEEVVYGLQRIKALTQV